MTANPLKKLANDIVKDIALDYMELHLVKNKHKKGQRRTSRRTRPRSSYSKKQALKAKRYEDMALFGTQWRKRILEDDEMAVLALPINDEGLVLSDYLGVKYLSLVNNATIGLILAQKALKFHGEIITTPYSFIATVHSIIWNGLEPVFVDTDNTVGNLDPDRVEEAINNKTGGILAVHNYGIPGEVEALRKISEKYNLPLIYDAAPSLGVRYYDETILKHGDMAVLSFHATKVFTTTGMIEIPFKLTLLPDFKMVLGKP